MSDEQKKSTLYLDRSEVRGIILRSQEIGVEVTQSLLMQVDHLPIVTADDMRGPAATPASDALRSLCEMWPHSIYTEYHLDNWTAADFAKHTETTMKTVRWLVHVEKEIRAAASPHSRPLQRVVE